MALSKKIGAIWNTRTHIMGFSEARIHVIEEARKTLGQIELK